jgi:hypothetical protein
LDTLLVIGSRSVRMHYAVCTTKRKKRKKKNGPK